MKDWPETRALRSSGVPCGCRAQIIAGTQITALWHLHGFTWAAAHIVALLGWRAAGWPAHGLREEPGWPTAPTAQSSAWEGLFGFTFFGFTFFAQLTSVGFALGSGSLQPTGFIPSSELTVSSVLLRSFSILAGRGRSWCRRATCHTSSLVQSSSSWTLHLQLKDRGFVTQGTKPAALNGVAFRWARCEPLEMALL